ncbi:hypothetical protein FNV43_RR20225 [Rhamnella rubrinervis]|uniref:ATP-dependent Clp protease proteolytic subunit n=1 Tax=Rhamnella rubrinervis TaxID=2594499 RepID=A0A8K0GQ95_9ROSA|nr:hypothetical protein FNV43_RR20225 [Rhamnella rubrinervis]
MGFSISDDTAHVVVAQLLFLESENPSKPINMYLNSPGGDATAGSLNSYIIHSLTHSPPALSFLFRSCKRQSSTSRSLVNPPSIFVKPDLRKLLQAAIHVPSLLTVYESPGGALNAYVAVNQPFPHHKMEILIVIQFLIYRP